TSTPMFIDPEISTQADGAQSSRVPVPLSKDSYKAIRQAYLVGTDTESEPIEEPESPHTVASPTCHVEESEGSDTSGTRSTSSDSTTPLSPDHLLIYATPTLVPVLCRTARMVVRVPPTMSPSLSACVAEVVALSDSAFRKRFRSSYESSPFSSPPDLPSRKHYRGTSKLVEDDDEEGDDEEEDEEMEESLDSDSVSKDAEDEGPTVEDEDHTAGDDGLAVGEEGPVMGVESLSLGGDEAVPGGQQRASPVAETAVGELLGLGYGALRRQEIASGEGRMPSVFEPTLTTWMDPEDGIVYIDVRAYPPPAPPAKTPPSLEWLSGSLPISPAPSIVPLPVSSPMISLTVPSPAASPATAETEGFLTELGARVEMQGGLVRDHTVGLEELSHALFERYDRDIRKLFTRPGAVREEIFSQRYRLISLEHEQERVAVTFGAIWRPVLALESWLAKERRARLKLAEIVDGMRRGQGPRGDV
ncbi:hypothetical protein Tco_0331697, partial [Tanacetum coccineum]